METTFVSLAKHFVQSVKMIRAVWSAVIQAFLLLILQTNLFVTNVILNLRL
jgi:hypothetical protein